ncbi:AAA family ATPase [Lederbergia citrisecunda]|uniref:AAA family ATPase n=1 Tax=Lederbergia citrisecunda TaxID=2833583 RepID=UPI003D29376C
MSFRKKIKNNVPRVALESITTLVAGDIKTGKTRLWKEVTEMHYVKPEEALLLAFEDGYETWELDEIIPLHAEGTDKDLWKVWEYFKKDVVPGLVKEAKEGRVAKLIGVDTADRAIDACTAWVLNDRKRKYGKVFESIQDISESTGGKENGWTALHDELKSAFDTLKNAGYGLFYLAWTKERETTLYDGRKFNSLELAMSNTGRKVFASQASLICCLHNEVNILNKDGEILDDNAKSKSGKVLASNFHETKSMMYFRPSEFIGIAGGRFTDLPEKEEYSAENFLKVFEEAVKGQLKKTTTSVEDLKKNEDVEKQEKADETAERMEVISTEELMKEIHAIIENMNLAKKTKAAEGFEEAFGVRNYLQEKDNPTNLKKALEIVKDAAK